MAAPNYWWTGTKTVAGGETPQAGWIPVNVGSNYADIYSAYLNPEYANPYQYDVKKTREYDPDTGWINAEEPLYYSPEQIRSTYGINYGEPYAPELPPPPPPDTGGETDENTGGETDENTIDETTGIDFSNPDQPPDIDPGEGNTWGFNEGVGIWTIVPEEPESTIDYFNPNQPPDLNPGEGNKWFFDTNAGYWTIIPAVESDELTGVEINEEGKPEIPAERKYGYLSGEEFFSGQYGDEYSQYFEPYLQGGATMDDLASQYAGIPVVSGYWEIGPNGEEQFVPEQSLYDVASTLREMGEIDYPSFEEWLAETGQTLPQLTDLGQLGVLDDIDRISGELETTPDFQNSEAYRNLESLAADYRAAAAGGDRDQILQEEARAAGFIDDEGNGDVDAYNAWKESQVAALGQGAGGQQGLYGTRDEWTMDRAQQQQIQVLVDSNSQMIESLGMKSSAAAYNKMAEVSNSIASANLQYGVKKMEENRLRQEYEYEQLKWRYETLTNTGLEAGRELADQIQENRMGAMEAYATELSTLIEQENQRINGLSASLAGYGMELEAAIEENQEALTLRQTMGNEYGRDMTVLAEHADTMYRKIMLDIGYDEHMIAAAEAKYNEYMAPYWTALEAWYQEEIVAQGGEALDIERELAGASASATSAAQRANTASTYLTGAATGAGIGGMIAGVPGAVVGGIVGLAAALLSNVLAG